MMLVTLPTDRAALVPDWSVTTESSEQPVGLLRLESIQVVPAWTRSLAVTRQMNDAREECSPSSERQEKHQAAGDQAAASAHPRSPNCYPIGSYASFRLFGSRSSCFGRSIRCRDRMISMSFLRPLGGPIMIAPTRRSSLKKSLR